MADTNRQLKPVNADVTAERVRERVMPGHQLTDDDRRSLPIVSERSAHTWFAVRTRRYGVCASNSDRTRTRRRSG
jgi:hypothetical protein